MALGRAFRRYLTSPGRLVAVPRAPRFMMPTSLDTRSRYGPSAFDSTRSVGKPRSAKPFASVIHTRSAPPPYIDGANSAIFLSIAGVNFTRNTLFARHGGSDRPSSCRVENLE